MNRIIDHATRIYFYQALSMLISFAVSILLAQSLGPEGKGNVDIYFSFVGIFSGGITFGLGYGVIKYVSRQRELFASIHGACVLYFGGLFLLSIVYWVLSVLMQDYWVNTNLSKIISLAFLATPLVAYNALFTSFFIAHDRTTQAYRLAAFLSLIYFSAVVLMVSRGQLTPQRVMNIYIASNLLIACISYYWLKRIHHPDFYQPKILKKVVSFGIILYLISFANVLHFKIDQIMLNHWASTSDVGVYAVAVRFGELLLVLDSGLIMAAYYRLITHSQQSNRLLLKKIIMVQLILSLCAALALALIIPYVINLFYGTAFMPAVQAVYLLMPGIILWLLSRSIAINLNFQSNKAQYILIFSWATCLLNIVLNYILLKSTTLGIHGVAIASSISYAACAIAIFILGWQFWRTPFKAEVHS